MTWGDRKERQRGDEDVPKLLHHLLISSSPSLSDIQALANPRQSADGANLYDIRLSVLYRLYGVVYCTGTVAREHANGSG